MLEHLHHEAALMLLHECWRVLRPGGVCRAVVPDLEILIQRYVEAKKRGDPEAGTKLMEASLFHEKQLRPGLPGLFYRITQFHAHKWMYDAASLQKLFETAGFVQVHPAQYLDSQIPAISDVEDEGRILGGQGIAVEGIKA